MTWIYFLNNNLEVFERFLEFKALVENQTYREMKMIRTNHGGEFYGKDLDHFYNQQSIASKITTP